MAFSQDRVAMGFGIHTFLDFDLYFIFSQILMQIYARIIFIRLN
ncbi:hypothetical protein HCMG_00707 [Helicobacter canadensis MIT 98-5491]|nr:hypothetical protein HCMG_00707 [Helicobacter canadensis MIT 98-5491]